MLGALTHQKAGTLLAEQLAQHVLRDVLSLVDDSNQKNWGSPRPFAERGKGQGSAKKRAHQRLIAQADQSICLSTSGS